MLGYGLARSFCEFFREPDPGHVLTLGAFHCRHSLFPAHDRCRHLALARGRQAHPRFRRCPTLRLTEPICRCSTSCARASRRMDRCRWTSTCGSVSKIPRHGYWQRAATIGADGDFVTAPEISQVFGELIGLWSAVVWQGMGRPSPLRLVELGPGRGTLMRDAWRAARAMPRFLDAATIHLIEVSASLRAAQKQTLASLGSRATWHLALDQVPPGAAIVVANEFLDALPIRQLVSVGDAWHERVIDVGLDCSLRFAVGPRVDFRSAAAPENGAIVELRAGEDEVLRVLAARTEPCIALFLDYGPAEPSIRRHAAGRPPPRLRRSAPRAGDGRPDRSRAVCRLGGEGSRRGPCNARPDHPG